MQPTPDTEEQFLTNYKTKNYPPFSYTADLCLFAEHDGELLTLLIERGNHPYKGAWALPGGFVDIDESSENAAARELWEETRLTVAVETLHQLKTYSAPGRDPRGRVVSTAYTVLLPTPPVPVASDDARKAEWVPVSTLDLTRHGATNPNKAGPSVVLAFDHAEIVWDALQWVRGRQVLPADPAPTAV